MASGSPGWRADRGRLEACEMQVPPLPIPLPIASPVALPVSLPIPLPIPFPIALPLVFRLPYRLPFADYLLPITSCRLPQRWLWTLLVAHAVRFRR
jgi:hypothetical protein